MFSRSPKQVAISTQLVPRGVGKKYQGLGSANDTRSPLPHLSSGLEAGSPARSCTILCPPASSSGVQGPYQHTSAQRPGTYYTLRSRRTGRAPGVARATHPGALRQVVAAQRVVEVEAHHVAGGQGKVLSHSCAGAGAQTEG